MKATTMLVAIAMLAGTAQADRKVAEQYFRAGAEAYHAQDFQSAAESFDLAYAEAPLPEIAFSGAQAYRRRYQGDPQASFVKRAIELYRAYLAAVKKGGKVREASDHVEAMQAELRKLEGQGAVVTTAPSAPRTTRIGVSVVIAGHSGSSDIGAISDSADASTFEHVEATLDGKPIEPFAMIAVAPGPHTVTAVADGYLAAQKQTVAVEGEPLLVELELKAKPAQLAITALSGARIAIDGRTVGTTPTAPIDLAPGRHVIAITHRGRQPVVREITVARGQALALAVPLVATERRRAVKWVLIGAGATGVLALLAAGNAAKLDGEASDLRDAIALGNQPPSVADDYDTTIRERDAATTTTWVFGSVAVVSAAVGLGLYLFDHPSAESVQVTPIVTSTSAAFGVSGHF